MAQIQICGKRKFLGYYDTEKEAANVYQKAIPDSTSSKQKNLQLAEKINSYLFGQKLHSL